MTRHLKLLLFIGLGIVGCDDNDKCINPKRQYLGNKKKIPIASANCPLYLNIRLLLIKRKFISTIV